MLGPGWPLIWGCLRNPLSSFILGMVTDRDILPEVGRKLRDEEIITLLPHLFPVLDS